MIKAAAFPVLLVLCTGLAWADGPRQTQGPAGGDIDLRGREDVCQYGFQDDNPGSGTTLTFDQQLGIHCPGPITITGVGVFIEFIVIGGQIDIVIFDGGAEVQRTTVTPVQGVNEFDVPDIQVSDACIMLCPLGSYLSVTGDDYTNGPFGNCYWSTNCTCQAPITYENLMIWARTGQPTASEPRTWGTIKTLYR